MGTESRRPAYINHDAMKFPGVGDYSVDRGGFGNNGLSMRFKHDPKPNLTPGPLDYSPAYKLIQHRDSSPTTFGTSGRNLDPIANNNGRRNRQQSGSFDASVGRNGGQPVNSGLQRAGQSILSGRSTTPGPGQYLGAEKLKVLNNSPGYSLAH